MSLPRPLGPAAARARAARSFPPKFAKPVGLHCEGCALETLGVGYVPDFTPALHPIVLLGEAPGWDEVRLGEPFVGAAGSMLVRVLRLLGKTRGDYRVANVVHCLPPDFAIARFPTAVAQCRYRDAVLHAPETQVVVAMGATALKAVLGFAPDVKGVRVEDFHGTVTREPGGRFWVVGGFHPSYLQRGATNLIGVSAFDLSRAHEIVEQGWPADPGVLVVDPPIDWVAAYVASYAAAAAQDPYAYPLAVDIETPDKGTDEGALVGTVDDASYQIKRVNLSCHPDEGVTVPYEGPYIALVDQALALAAVKYFWFKGYDEPRLRAAGHQWDPRWSYDCMWAAKALQSDLPQGLGFWAPLYSRWGAWKHLSDVDPGRYGAIDGLQTRRTGDGVFGDLASQGRTRVFLEDMHDFHRIVLQPATDVGVPVDRARLAAFREKLDTEAGRLLEVIADAVPPGLCPRTPKAGLTRPPAPGDVHTKARNVTTRGQPKKHEEDPLKRALYARATIVESLVLRSVIVCKTCGKTQVTKTHRCRPADVPADAAVTAEGRPILMSEIVSVRRWFWQEPFNPDSPPQLLAYAKAKGHKTGIAKKTGEPSMDRETLARLIRETADPVYIHTLAYRAVAKVRGTYVLGTERKLDAEDRLHGTFGFKPSTMRLNGTSPNLQNVVADKTGTDSLAAGFRTVVVARGRWVPAGSGWEDEAGGTR